MKHTSVEHTDHPAPRASVLWFGALALVASACGGGGGGGSPSVPIGLPLTIETNPNAGIDDSKRFIVDPHSGGLSQNVRMSGMFWGRLVDVHGIDAAGGRDPIPQQRDFLIGSNVISDGQDYLLEVNPVTSKTLLTILRLPTDPEFVDLLVQAEQNLPPIFDQPINGAGIFSMVPRNATIVLKFDDLLEPSTITPDTIQVLTGDPAITPYNARILPDTNHGGLAIFPGDLGETFYPTRVLIDTTISELESFETDPPLQPNGVGFPSSSSVNLANVVLRVPTHVAPSIGQTTILQNPSAHSITTISNGSIDPTTASIDLVRAMRSGGNGLVTGDSFNGFLEDVDSPSVVGTQPVVINIAPVPNDPMDESRFLLPQVQYLSVFCAQTPEAGDILQQAGFFAEIVEAPAPVQNGVLSNVVVRLLLGNAADWPVSGVGAAEYVSTFDPADDTGKETCFVRITPTPAGFPLAPNEGIATNSEIGVRFTEPMDPASMTAFDSLTLTRVPVPMVTSDYIVGRVDQSGDLQQFTFVPDLPLRHQGPPVPLEESYFLRLSTGDLGPTDLAGNQLSFPLPTIEVKIDPNASTRENGGRVTRFTSTDEELPLGDEMTGPLPEWTGQHLYDLVRELIRPRPVVRYEAVADRTQAVPSLMLAFPQGVQTPLSNLGSRMQTVWRYADVGFGLQDITNFNVDVEGLNWSPVGGQIVADNYTSFEISLSHSKYQPDEYIDPSSLFPKFPQSGLKNSYANNVLDGPQRIVHPRELGYTVSPSDYYISGTGTGLMPYPMNQSIPVSEYRTFTWRDTAKLMRGGTPAPTGSGVEIFQNFVILGIGPMNFMTAGNIETIGLPLLMDFKCFPDGDALGLNALDISLGTNSSARPNFRAFSTGGTNTAQIPVPVNPDLATIATGGYNPTSTPIPGQTTFGLDNTFYIGSMDLVVRVSRTYSVWFGTQDSEILSPAYNPAVKEPRDVDQPQGTSIELAYRGAINIVSPVIQPVVTTNAAMLDGYGDFYQPPAMGPTLHNNPNPTFNFLNDSAWHDDVSDIDGAPYYQIRVTFLSNIETALSPELSALGITWQVLN